MARNAYFLGGRDYTDYLDCFDHLEHYDYHELVRHLGPGDYPGQMKILVCIPPGAARGSAAASIVVRAGLPGLGRKLCVGPIGSSDSLPTVRNSAEALSRLGVASLLVQRRQVYFRFLTGFPVFCRNSEKAWCCECDLEIYAWGQNLWGWVEEGK